MTYLRFTSVILPLDMDSFEEIDVFIFLGGKRLVWKPMGFYLVVSSLYRGGDFVIFSIFKTSDVPSIPDLDIFIKMDAFWKDLEKKFVRKCDRGPHEGGCFVWRGQVSDSGYGLQCVTWPEEGKKVEKAHRVALMLKWRVTKSNFPNVGADGGPVECSHLCHNKICVNVDHLHLEPHSINSERTHCKLQGQCARCHFPYCILCKKFKTYFLVDFTLCCA